MRRDTESLLRREFLTPRYWADWLLFGLMLLISRLPYRLTMPLGRLAGLAGLHLAKYRRHIAETNLALCFPDTPPETRDQWLREQFQSLGMAAVETALVWLGKRTKVTALSGVSFECRPGEVFGLLGPNGAGKTTALRIISTALRASGGRGSVMGFDISSQSRKVRESIGFLSSNTGLYGRLSPREVLRYFGRLYSMEEAALDRRIAEVSEMFDMKGFLDRACDKLSTGMRQKVNIARTVIHSPPVMVLDEPTSGLDVLTSRTIVQFIRQCRDEGRTVLFSTHVIPWVEAVCERVVVIDRGKIVADGTIADMTAGVSGGLEEVFRQLTIDAPASEEVTP